MIDRLLELAPVRPWVVLPVAAGEICRDGHLELLDWLLHDPARRAYERDFFIAAPGETLAVSPGIGAFAGLLLVGYRGGSRLAVDIGAEIAPFLPRGLFRERHVVVLPPEPCEETLTDAWWRSRDELAAMFARACPEATEWLIEDWLREVQ